ncbi:hypothetical protein V5E97_33525 [Singulisphaera sp. Ch08]|uniref:Uncharacterized protein n=1 Tax=Singulisphaera sp. Ch08 TaxID=3120278 RepID=A0AAU7CDE6_9BACT
MKITAWIWRVGRRSPAVGGLGRVERFRFIPRLRQWRGTDDRHGGRRGEREARECPELMGLGGGRKVVPCVTEGRLLFDQAAQPMQLGFDHCHLLLVHLVEHPENLPKLLVRFQLLLTNLA